MFEATVPVEPRRLRVPADVHRLAEIRAFVRQAVENLGGSKQAATDLVQAVDEATCNVVLHGYRGRDGDIEIEIATRDRRIEINVLDRGPVFDPTALPPPDVSNPPQPPRDGGMGVGIHLLRTLTDQVRHHERPGGGNVLTLVRSMGDRSDEEG